MPILETWGWFGTRVPVRLPDDGSIDDNVERAFTNGHCHSFALAVHGMTNWPIMGLISTTGDSEDSPGHCVLFDPKRNDYFDIGGYGAKERWKANVEEWWGADIEVKEVLITPADISNFTAYMEPEVEVARPFAKTLLAGLDIVSSDVVVSKKRRTKKRSVK